ncbi:unnamed protein product [Sphagnum jensenii]|uniref:C2H2-type domain-containing protein n=1 Tax=Sphagnum jensenii TaxID=128206 RepID=A0ABP0W3Z3_9BRYO
MPAPEKKPTQSKDKNSWVLSILVRFSSGFRIRSGLGLDRFREIVSFHRLRKRGIEVPAGKPVTCSPGQGMYLHISQAALDEIKNADETTAEKSNKRVVIRAQVGDEKEIVLGTLSYGRCDQMPLDLVFGNGDADTDEDRHYLDASLAKDVTKDEAKPKSLPPATVAVSGKSNGDAAEGKTVKTAKPGKLADPLAVAKAAKLAGTALGAAAIKAVDAVQKHGNGDEDDQDMADDDDDDVANEANKSDEKDLKIEASKAGKKRPAVDSPKVVPSEKKAKVDAAEKLGNKAAAEYWQSLIAAGSKGKSPTLDKKGNIPAGNTPSTKAPKGTPGVIPTTPTSGKKSGDFKCSDCDKGFTSESGLTMHKAAKHPVK